MNRSPSNGKELSVTILVPAYNAGIYLRPCLESLILQSLKISRIVVIDDLSTDNSISSIADFEESRLVEIFHNQSNLGKSNSLNNCFNTIETDYFIIQDADDIAKPERVARQIAFMEENPDVACSSSFVEYINADGNYIADGKLDILNDARLYEYLAGDEPLGLYCPAVILRASVVKDPSLQFRGEFWPADDIDLWNRIAEKGYKVRAQPEKLVSYRIHGSSVVTSGFSRARMQFEWVRACMRSRRQGLPEPTHEQFLATWNNASLWKRLNRLRKFLAKGYYRAAGFAAAEKKYVSAVIKCSFAIFLQPTYSLLRITRQLSGRLSNDN